MVFAKAVHEEDSFTLTGLIKKHDAPGSTIYTDELSSYNRVRYLRDDDGIRSAVSASQNQAFLGRLREGRHSHQHRRGALEPYQERNSRRLSFGFARLLADIPRRIHLSVQPQTRWEQAIPSYFAAGRRTGVIIVRSSSLWKASRVMGRIFSFVSLRGFDLRVRVMS